MTVPSGSCNSGRDQPELRSRPLCQRRPNPAHDDFLGLGAGNNESADEDVVARLHVQPGRDVQERGLGDDVEPKDRALAACAAACGRATKLPSLPWSKVPFGYWPVMPAPLMPVLGKLYTVVKDACRRELENGAETAGAAWKPSRKNCRRWPGSSRQTVARHQARCLVRTGAAP